MYDLPAVADLGKSLVPAPCPGLSQKREDICMKGQDTASCPVNGRRVEEPSVTRPLQDEGSPSLLCNFHLLLNFTVQLLLYNGKNAAGSLVTLWTAMTMCAHGRGTVRGCLQVS